MEYIPLIAFLGLIAGVVGFIVGVIFLRLAALFIFVWREVYPIAQRVAVWMIRPYNFLPFVLYMLALIVVIIPILIAVMFAAATFATEISTVGEVLSLAAFAVWSILVGTEVLLTVVLAVPFVLGLILAIIKLIRYLFDVLRIQFWNAVGVVEKEIDQMFPERGKQVGDGIRKAGAKLESLFEQTSEDDLD